MNFTYLFYDIKINDFVIWIIVTLYDPVLMVLLSP